MTKTVLLGDVYDVRDGTHDSLKYQSEGYPLVTSKNLKNNRLDLTNVRYISEKDYLSIKKRSGVSAGDILFAMIGTIGNPVLISEEPNYAIKNVALFKVPPTQDGKYLKYYLDSHYVINKMQKEAKGTTQRFVGLGYLRNFPIRLPSLEEQKRIVKKMDEAFEKIDKTKENTEKNQKKTQELFESNLEKLFSTSSWSKLRLEDVLLKTSNINWAKEGEKERTYIDLTSVDRGSSSIEPSLKVNRHNAPSRAKKIVLKNDIIFGTTRPTLKRIALISERFDNQICSTGFCVLRADWKKINNKIIFYFLKTKNFMKNMEKLQRGASYPAVTDKDVKSQIIKYPKDINEQEKIVKRLDKLSEQTKKLQKLYQQKLDNLEELKQSLLKQAFSGKL